MISEAACIASGPSLTQDDVELVKAWRERSSGRYVIVVNTTFRIATWADELYAMDRAWWKAHADEVAATFPGRRSTSLKGIAIAKHVSHDRGKNSGYGALVLAIKRGAKRVILLGYDAQKTDGKTHWHGDHPKGLGNAGSIHRWVTDFERASRNYACRARILNASRQTALKCFERVSLEDALSESG